MALTSYGDQQALKQLFGGGAASTPTNLYFGLSSTTIAIDGTGITEPSAQVQLNSALTNGSAYTTLTVLALTAPIANGASIKLTSGANTQTVTASASASIGATSITVTSFTANFAYPVGTLVQDLAGAYARKAMANTTGNFSVTQIAVGSGGGAQVQNAASIDFPQSTAAWPNPVTYWFASDNAGNGNIVAYGALSASQTVGANNTLSFAINALTLQDV